ncbi:hypothetical protein E3N88_38681 [Mikania micrantha]|uniref:Uncharacterized protein n=1 Tax=Mikania micrantha TaxID=192012 RepID=A0A5N6LUN3_9ASTR|nr:hypothetical protein E3N88_38681 [Mikania micrantha]
MIFRYLSDNITKAKDRLFMYPRFIQMLIDEKFPEQNLPRVASDILKLKHMIDSSLGQVKIYQKSNDVILTKDLICHCARANYVAPLDDASRHDDSNSESEQMDDDDDDQQPPPPPQYPQVRQTQAQSSQSHQQEQEQETPNVTHTTFVPLQVIYPNQPEVQVQADSTVSSPHVEAENVDAKVEEESTESKMETVQAGNRMVRWLKRKPMQQQQNLEEREQRNDPNFIVNEPETSRPKKKKKMANVPKRKKSRTPRIIVSSPVTASSAPVSISPQILRKKLERQGIRGPKTSFLYGNVGEMQKIQAAAISKKPSTSINGDFVGDDYTCLLFPYFEQWRKQYVINFKHRKGKPHSEGVDFIEDILIWLGVDRRVTMPLHCRLRSTVATPPPPLHCLCSTAGYDDKRVGAESEERQRRRWNSGWGRPF